MLVAAEQRGIQNVEGLSQVIIETIQSLSEHEPLTTSFLSEALGRRGEVRDMLATARPEKTQREKSVQNREVPLGNNGQANAPWSAKNSGQDTVLKAAVEEREEILRMSNFLKRSVTTMVSLVDRSGPGRAVSEALARFRNDVNEKNIIEELEKSLDALKSSIISLPGEEAPGPEGAVPVKSGSTAVEGRQEVVHVQKLKSIFLSIVSEFEQDLGEDYSNKLANLHKNILSGTKIEDLTALKDDLLLFIQAYNRIMNEERNQITDFISEIESNLMEIERHSLNWIKTDQNSHTASASFQRIIETHVEDMKKSAQLSSTLAEFKSLVISRLAYIREALEQKRKAEALREETLNGEVENLQQSLQRMKKEIDQVQEKRKALEKEVLIDQLTGIANRRALKQRAKEEIQRYHRYHQNFSVLLFDIDHFKSVNDRFGHWAGDKCLKELIKRIRPMLRETDFLARWGGEEFVILFPGIDLDSAFGVAERLRRAIENTRFLYHKQEIGVTVSIGATEVRPEDQNLEMLFNRTDKAMYDAKKKGRNTVVKA